MRCDRLVQPGIYISISVGRSIFPRQAGQPSNPASRKIRLFLRHCGNLIADSAAHVSFNGLKNMNILALVPSICGNSPGQRSSIELWDRILRPAGINLIFAPFETERLRGILYARGRYVSKSIEVVRAYLERLRLTRNLSSFDAVFVYREAALLGPAILERRIAQSGKPLIYQLDDPLYVPYRSPTNGYLSYLKCFSKVADICRLSKVVIVNSRQIKEYALKYNNNVWQIPSVVDSDVYVFQPRASSSTPTCIGWSGSPTTVGNLRVIADALRELAGRVDHGVHFIGGTRFDLPGVSYTAQNWRAETEVEDLRRIEVGVVPLPINEWNKRKFYMKVVQYMSLGIPTVCTPLGSNPDVVEHGVTGFLANTTSEWVEYLEKLIRDSSLRLSMGQNAARVAREKYSLAANAGRIIGAFNTAVT